MTFDFLGTMTREMWERLKAFSQNQQGDMKNRAKHLQAEALRARKAVKLLEHADNALRNNNTTPTKNIQNSLFQMLDIDSKTIAENIPRGDYGMIAKPVQKALQVARGALADSEAAEAVTFIKDSLIEVIRFKKENLEFRFKKAADLEEMLTSEAALLERRFEEILALINLIEQLFSDETNHRRHLFETKHPFTARGTLTHEEVLGTRPPEVRFSQNPGSDQPSNPVSPTVSPSASSSKLPQPVDDSEFSVEVKPVVPPPVPTPTHKPVGTPITKKGISVLGKAFGIPTDIMTTIVSPPNMEPPTVESIVPIMVIVQESDIPPEQIPDLIVSTNYSPVELAITLHTDPSVFSDDKIQKVLQSLPLELNEEDTPVSTGTASEAHPLSPAGGQIKPICYTR